MKGSPVRVRGSASLDAGLYLQSQSHTLKRLGTLFAKERSRLRLRTLTLFVCAVLAAVTLGAATASADPTTKHPNALAFEVACPGMAPFDVVVVGAPGFVQGQPLIVIRHPEGRGSLDLVECTATDPAGQSFTVFLQFVQRG
jgi:hypothetical protein